MRVRQAQSRCPGLLIAERDLAAETRLFEPVVRRLEEEVMPRLEVVRPGLLAAPAKGPARYWGGEGRFAARIGSELGRLGFPVRVGGADSAFAAALAARAGGGMLVPAGAAAGLLAPYPVAVLGRPRLTDVLTRIGIGTLGAFAALPAHHVLARFGADGLAARRTAAGLDPRPPAARTAVGDYTVRARFEDGGAEVRLEPVVFAAKSLAGQLHDRLERAGVVAARVGIEVVLAGGGSRERVWRHEGRLSSLAVAERVRWQLQAWADDGALTAAGVPGIAELVLRPDGLSAATGHQDVLFGTRSTPQDVARAAAQVQAMLGHQAVTRAVAVGGRSPGERIVKVPFGDTAPQQAGGGPWPGRIPPPYPAAVHDRPLPARVLDASGRDVVVSGRLVVSAAPVSVSVDGVPGVMAVTGWSAPWPVLDAWWDPSRARRIARLQVVTATGGAWLLLLDRGRWWAEAHYG
jgi:protein ImuB